MIIRAKRGVQCNKAGPNVCSIPSSLGLSRTIPGEDCASTTESLDPNWLIPESAVLEKAL